MPDYVGRSRLWWFNTADSDYFCRGCGKRPTILKRGDPKEIICFECRRAPRTAHTTHNTQRPMEGRE